MTRCLLAHRRLSIVDLAGGHQPLSNEDGTVWVTYNGEIYNHADVRSVLETTGHRYRTKSDTETIVHAYEEWGDECVHRFRGMFAFAIWDAAAQRLLAGARPARRQAAVLGTGGQPPAVRIRDQGHPRERPDRSREANDAVLSEVLATRYTSGADTLFRGIHKLLPGHRLIFQNGTIRTDQYWDLPLDGPGSLRSPGPR